MKRIFLSVLAAALSGAVWGVEPITFNAQSVSTNDPIDSAAAERAFISAVTAGGLATFAEDFEDPVWNGTRTPSYDTNVLSKLITWHSSTGNGLRTTPDSGSYEVPPPYMVYAYDPVSGLHPIPNTLFGESAIKLYGIGFWAVGTGTKGKIKVILDDTVEVKFQRIIGYTYNPPDPPEPTKETVRLTYEMEFFGVYAPDGFNKFQLLEFAGEPDEVVLMWMRTFTFAKEPAIQITDIDHAAGSLEIQFLADSPLSNLTLQANSNLRDTNGWANTPYTPTVVSQNLYRVVSPMPPETNKMFRVISAP